MAFGGTKRSARARGSPCPGTSLPDGHANWNIRIPAKNEPSESHGVPDTSFTTAGSIAL